MTSEVHTGLEADVSMGQTCTCMNAATHWDDLTMTYTHNHSSALSFQNSQKDTHICIRKSITSNQCHAVNKAEIEMLIAVMLTFACVVSMLWYTVSQYIHSG